MNNKNDNKKDDLDPLSAVLHKHAAVVITEPGEHGALSAAEILAWRSWFERRRPELTSSGGRPTNPRWDMKRQIPFSTEVWRELEARAEACSSGGQKIAPGQLAAFIVEEGVTSHGSYVPSPSPESGDRDAETNDFAVDDPNASNWRMPEPFAGCVR